MKALTIHHKGLTYRFEFFESTGEVSIIRDGKPTYQIIWIKSSHAWSCNCPGAKYHGYCWHREQIPLLLAQPSNHEPWTDWAEEASKMRLENGRR